MRTRLPNALSLSRVLLGVVIVALAQQLNAVTYFTTLAATVVAFITDVLDGHLARRWHVATETGYILDGLGDRAFHVALLLVFLTRYGFHPIFVWLLVFRDVALYALRILRANWYAHARGGRWLTLLYGWSLRSWIAMFLIRDGVRITTGADLLSSIAFDIVQSLLLASAIVWSYLGLFRSLVAVIEHDHATLEAAPASMDAPSIENPAP
ncbi:MAG TPA: CDP-alcohol phosphatidyltransferase family protein [Candidatus Elarobacter sp.]|nr:CDP-alcohol phosphatidyltransferase family protein [Candidatus Elarobacter sp.]